MIHVSGTIITIATITPFIGLPFDVTPKTSEFLSPL